MTRGDPLYQALVGAIVGGGTALIFAVGRPICRPIYRWIIQFPLWKRRLIFWPVVLAISGSIYVMVRS